MSGGRFDYLQSRFEWNDAIEIINSNVINNKYNFNEETIIEFKKAIIIIEKARIYLQRIDYLLSDDDSEKTFHERLIEDFNSLNLIK